MFFLVLHCLVLCTSVGNKIARLDLISSRRLQPNRMTFAFKTTYNAARAKYQPQETHTCMHKLVQLLTYWLPGNDAYANY